MTELVNGYAKRPPGLLDKAALRFRITDPDRMLLQRVEEALEAAGQLERATLLTDQLSQLPVDTPTLIAGYAFFAVLAGELDIDDIGNSDTGKLLRTLVRLSSTDSAATYSVLLQVRRNTRQADNVRRMLVAMIDDPRVVVLKMVERLVQLHPLIFNGSATSLRTAHEVLHFFAPLANRLGIWQLKWVLEDYAFRCLQPDAYHEIASRFTERRSAREELVGKLQADLEWRLDEVGISAEILGRAKNIYGVYRKMREKNIDFDDVHDVLAIRVIVDSVPKCYQVLGVVHTSWPHIANEFDDYIANPKSNGYRSLHTAVYGPQGHVLEVQIRTREMHLDSELGVCSHWSYKGENDATLDDANIDWMREVLNWHEGLNVIDDDASNAEDISRSEGRTYVSTPQRHVIDLEAGSTALDFAFKVHTDIGLHCVGALVDGVEVALNTVLQSGQTVEIITSDRAKPQREWLDRDLKYYKSSKTRDLLRAFFQDFDRTYNVNAGRDWVQQEIDRLNLKLTPEEAASALDFDLPDDLFIEVALGSMKARQMLVEIAQLHAEVSDLLQATDVAKSTMHIRLKALDRKNLIRDITREIAALNVNVVNFQLGAPKLEQEAVADIWVEVTDLQEVSLVIVSLRRLHRVTDVRLVSSDSTA